MRCGWRGEYKNGRGVLAEEEASRPWLDRSRAQREPRLGALLDEEHTRNEQCKDRRHRKDKGVKSRVELQVHVIHDDQS